MTFAASVIDLVKSRILELGYQLTPGIDSDAYWVTPAGSTSGSSAVRLIIPEEGLAAYVHSMLRSESGAGVSGTDLLLVHIEEELTVDGRPLKLLSFAGGALRTERRGDYPAGPEAFPGDLEWRT